MEPNCNRCDRKGCRGFSMDYMNERNCKRWINPEGKFKLIELALAYPDSLNQVLSSVSKSLGVNFQIQDYI